MTFNLPRDVFGEMKTGLIRFDGAGRLDPLFHALPIQLELTDAPGFRKSDQVVRAAEKAAAAKNPRRTRKLRPQEQKSIAPGEEPQPDEAHIVRITIERAGHVH